MILNLGVLLILLNSLMVSLSAFFFKNASTEVTIRSPISMLKNGWIWIDICLAPLKLLLNVTAYQYGDISLLYPLLQLSLVWNAIMAVVIFKETISSQTLFGTMLIFSGAVFVSLSA
ncbi:MAG: DMT family transporter [Chloroflexota bacterium]